MDLFQAAYSVYKPERNMWEKNIAKRFLRKYNSPAAYHKRRYIGILWRITPLNIIAQVEAQLTTEKIDL